MKAYIPQQVEIYYIIPAIRREMSRALVGMGMSQKQAAQKLGITEAAVSQYIKSKRGGKVVFRPGMMDEIRKSAKRVAGGCPAMKEIQSLCEIMRRKRYTCEISKKLGFAPSHCRECFR